MGWFSRKPSQGKYVEAAVTVASNLYFQTIPGAEDAPVALQFGLQDSRYRYLIFCFSAVVTAALAYDEKKLVQPEVLINGCLNFVAQYATESAQEFFDDPASCQDSVSKTMTYFQEFAKYWSRWPDLEKEGKNAETIDLISGMIHSTESNEPVVQADMRRLCDLALQIDCRLPTMRGAFVELANRKD